MLSDSDLKKLNNDDVDEIKNRANGRQIVVLPLVLYYDKFDKYNIQLQLLTLISTGGFYLQFAGLPRSERRKVNNIHFLSLSPPNILWSDALLPHVNEILN